MLEWKHHQKNPTQQHFQDKTQRDEKSLWITGVYK